MALVLGEPAWILTLHARHSRPSWRLHVVLCFNKFYGTVSYDLHCFSQWLRYLSTLVSNCVMSFFAFSWYLKDIAPRAVNTLRCCPLPLSGRSDFPADVLRQFALSYSIQHLTMSVEKFEKIPNLWNITLEDPPPGVVPDFDHPVTNKMEIHVTSAICLAIIFLFASSRLYAKLFILKPITVDDCEVPRLLRWVCC